MPGRPSYVLPQAPSAGSWPLPPATTQMVPGMAPPPAPANEEPTKVVRAKGVARARWNRDEEERLKKLVDLGVLLRCLHFTETTRVHLTMPGVVSFPILTEMLRAGRGARRQALLAEDLGKARERPDRLGRGTALAGHDRAAAAQRRHRPEGEPGATSERVVSCRPEGWPADGTTYKCEVDAGRRKQVARSCF